MIKSFADLCENVGMSVQSGMWCSTVTNDVGCFCRLSVVGVQKLQCSVKIDNRMCVQVCVGNNIVSAHDLQWILPLSLEVTQWSQLENKLQRYVITETACENCKDDFHTKLKNCVAFL